MKNKTSHPPSPRSMRQKPLPARVIGGLIGMTTVLMWVLTPQPAFAVSASGSTSISIDYQESLDGGQTWLDVGNGVLQNPSLLTGATIYARAIVTNTGTNQLDNVQAAVPGSSITFGGSSPISIAPGASVTSDVLKETVAAGYQSQTATVSGTASGTSTTVSASDSIDYTGITPSINIDMQISVNGGVSWTDVGNGVLQDPTITVGSTVDERVIVSNVGTTSLTNATVTDQGANGPSNFTFQGNPQISLAAGTSITSDIASFSALNGHQIGIATVNGTASDSYSNTATVSASDKADYTGIGAAPTLSGTVGPGSIIGSSEVTVSPLTTSDTLAYTLTTSSQSVPILNSALPTGATAYTSGTDIANVKPGQYLAIYEVNGSNQIQAWQQFVLQNADIDNISSITITSSSTSIASGQSVTVTGTVYDSNHQPVSGAKVGLSAANGSWQNASATSNGSGVYTDTWTAPTTYSNLNTSVTATVSGTSPAITASNSIQVLAAQTAAPSRLTHSNVTQTEWTETWSSVTGAASYDIYLNGALIGHVTSPGYQFTGEQPGSSYIVTVASVNGAGQVSVKSAPDKVTTARPYVPLSVATSFVWNGQYGVPYNPLQLQAVSGEGPYTWSVVSGSLPKGLSLSPSGLISGTPIGQNGNSTFTVQLTDAGGAKATQDFSITIVDAPVLTIATKTLPSAVQGKFYSTQLQASGAKPIAWAVISGSLPPGVTLNPDGSLGGVPSISGTFNLTLQVKDAFGNALEQTYALKVSAAKPGQGERFISWNGQLHTVPGTVRQNTTYMPIWYVMQYLKLMGIQSTWDGQNWRMTVPNKPNLAGVHVGTGNTSIYLNETLVQRIDTVPMIDPSTNRNTTYMPIWYAMQLLKRAGLLSTWDGTTWTVTK